jgi:hypothetical protein
MREIPPFVERDAPLELVNYEAGKRLRSLTKAA